MSTLVHILQFFIQRRMGFLLLFIIITLKSQAQVAILHEGFETDGEGVRYDSTWFKDINNHFTHSPTSFLPDLSGATGLGVITAGRVNNGGTDNPTDPFGIMVTKPVDVTGYANLSLSFFVAATPGVFDGTQDDKISIFYAFDGNISSSTWTKVAEFLPDGNNNSSLREDADLDGTPDGATLGNTLSEFNYAIPNGGTNLSIRFLVENTANDERIYFDELSISGDDIQSPSISTVAVPATDTYILGQALTFTVDFDEDVVVNTTGGTPTLPITIGGTPVSAAYQSGSGTTSLTFSYTVQSGDEDTDGISPGAALVLNGGTIADASANNAGLTLNSVEPTTGVDVDGIAPATTAVAVPSDGTYTATENLDFIVTFDDNVTVNTTGGTPFIELTFGASTVNAEYNSGSGTNQLTFRYSVTNGDLDADGIVVGAIITANGGTLRDEHGNNIIPALNSIGNTANVKIDAVVPGITSATAPTNATYTAGEYLDFTITFAEPVNVETSGGTPSLPVDVGGSSENAGYISGTGTSSIVFRYIVQLNDEDTDGIGLGSAITLNGGGIADAAGNDAVLTFTAPATSGILIDAINPAVTSFDLPPDDTYIIGDNLNFTVTYDENVTVNTTGGTPYLTIDVGGTPVTATYASGSGTSGITFTYTIAAGDSDADGIGITSPVQLNSGTIQDAAGNNAELAFTPGISTGILVDGIIPEVTAINVPANDTYITGENLDFIVDFDDVVTVSGTPSFNITIGTSTVAVSYLSGSGTNTLAFRYTVAAGDLDTDGIAIGSSIDLNGGAIDDASGNAADNTLNNIGSPAAIYVDAVAPAVTNVSVPPDNIYNIGKNLKFTVSFDEPVNMTGGPPTLALIVGSTTVNASYVSGAGTTALNFSYIVQPGDLDDDGVVPDNILLNGAAIEDQYSNQADLTLNNISSTINVKVDGVLPEISPDEMILSGSTVKFSLSEGLNLPDGASITGFTTENCVILLGCSYPAIAGEYSATTNTITLTNWNGTSNIFYKPASGNVVDLAGNEMAPINNHIVIKPPPIDMGAGDMAITSYSADDTPGAFSFVLMKDIEANTVINFTDKGWDGSKFVASNERIMAWKSSSWLYAGTEIKVKGTTASHGTLSAPDGPLELSTDGDQLLAYQGTAGDPTFIAAIQMEGTSWLAPFDGNTGGNRDRKSALPTGLTDGVTAIALTIERNNASYDRFTPIATAITSGTVPEVLAAIMGTPAHWNSSDNVNNVTYPDGSFKYAIEPEILSVYPANGSLVPGTTNQLQVTFGTNITAAMSTANDISLRRADNTLIKSWAINAPEVKIVDDILVIDISGVTLTHNTSYKVDLAERIIKDVAFGNYNETFDGASQWSFTVDALNPEVTTVIADPTVVTNGSSTNGLVLGNDARFIVTFSEGVTGVDATDFEIGSSSGSFSGTISVSANSATEYMVSIADIDTNTDLGKLVLIFTSNSSVIDVVGNPTLSNFTSTASFTIIKEEPTAHVSNFTAETGSDNYTIDLSWNAAAGTIPDGYLVEVKNASGSFAGPPVDLSTVTNDLDFSDGYGVVNAASTSISISNLNSATNYDFRIYPYTNNGDNVDYKTDGTAPEASGLTSHTSLSALTTAAFANDTILATINSETDALVNNFVFSIKDDGDATTAADQDNVPTLVNTIIINQGTGNDITDWTEAIEGAMLRDKNGNSIPGVISNNTITFSAIGSGPGDLGRIEDNQEKAYFLHIWLKSTLGGSLPATIDGLNFAFRLNEANIITETGGSSGITSGAEVATESTRNEVVVEATTFDFVTSPAAIEGVGTPLNSVAMVEVRDDNGNLDLNYDHGFTLSVPNGSTALFNYPTDGFTGDGMLDFTTFRYIYPGDATLTISNPDMVSATSTPVDAIGTLYDTSLQGVEPAGDLPSPGVDQIIFGFYLDAHSLTANQPVFENVAFSFSNDITNVFENLRLFKVVNASNNPVLGTDAIIVSGGAVNAGLSSGNKVVIDGFNEVLEPDGGTRNYYYLIADISKNTYSGSIQVQLKQPDIGLTAGSANGTTKSGAKYEFTDVENPSMTLDPAPGSVNVSSTIQPQLIFDEPVIALDSTFVVKLYSDDSEVTTITTLSGNADSTIFSFDPGQLLTDTKYYILFQPGSVANQTGFVDRSGKTAQGATTKNSWAFTTADAEPPQFTVTDPAELIVNEYDLGFDLRIQLDEEGEAHYLVVENGEPVPTVAEIFDPLTYGGDLIKADSFNILQPNTYYYESITGLSNNTDYTIYVVAKDNVPNKMVDGAFGIPLTLDVTTANSFSATIFPASAAICVGDFQEILEPIQIIEGDAEDMNDHGTYSFELALPNGFVFDQNTGDVSHADGGEITSSTLTYRNQTTAKITYTASGLSKRDQLTITGLRLKADLSASSGSIALLGDATNAAFAYGSVAGNITLSAIPPVPFSFDPQQALYLLSDFTPANPVSLVANATGTTGTNVFSGPDGIVGDQLYIPFAGVGLHEVALVHTDENHCQSSSTKTIEIIDESIFGLASSYCSNDNSDVILGDDPNPNNPRANFRLVSLKVDTVGISNPGDPESLSANGPNWDFNPEDAIINGAEQVEMNFVAIYERKSDPSKKDTIIQKVAISIPPAVSLRAIDQQHQNITLENNYCEDFGDVKIEGNPLPANALASGSFRIEKDGMPVGDTDFTDNGDGLLTFNPQTLATASGFGMYTIYYDYTSDQTLCSATASMEVFINAKPIANFPDNIPGCVDKPLAFQNTSTIETTDNLSFSWNFDDFDNISADNPNVSTAENPVHTFAASRTYNVELIAESEKACLSALISKQVTIGNNPGPLFSYEQIGIDQPTIFENKTGGLTSSTADSITTVSWDLNGAERVLLSSNLSKDVTDSIHHQFDSDGVKDISLTVETVNGCYAVYSDSIFVVPVETVTRTGNYEADFEVDNEGWIPWGSNSSWDVLTSGGNVINSSSDEAAGKTKFWVTGAGTYDENQKSYVYSPIFDLSDLERPMISLDIFNNLNTGRDGAVIEYSTTGYFGTWNILGSIGSGVAWYNTRDISNAAGDVNLTNSGWSDNDSSWVNAKHSLSVGNSRVQFRIAFASGANSTNHTFDGFAFDNVLIGERTRTVLIESFTNVNGSPASLIRDENNYLKNFAGVMGEDVIKINYHTDFPGADPINSANKIGPSARALFYNINTTPQTIIDGHIFAPDAPFSQWGQQEFELRSLALAQFDIQINPTIEIPGELTIETIVTPKIDVSAKNLLIYIAVLEKEIDLTDLGLSAGDIPSGEQSFEYVLRKILPNAAGFKISALDLALNEALEPIKVSFNPSAVADLSDMAVVVFVQDEATKVVYQSKAQMAIPAPERVTGADGEFSDVAGGFNIYPNPANENVNLILGRNLSDTPTVRIFDTFGKVVYEKRFDDQISTISIDTKELAAGMYHVQIEARGGSMNRKRVLVMHR